MGPDGLRSCPSVQLRHYCCLGELRQKVTKTDKQLYPPIQVWLLLLDMCLSQRPQQAPSPHRH